MRRERKERPNHRYLVWWPKKDPPETLEGDAEEDSVAIGTAHSRTYDKPETLLLCLRAATRSGGWVEVRTDARGEWRWTHVADNGLPLTGSTEGYRDRQRALRFALEFSLRYRVPLYMVANRPPMWEDLVSLWNR